MKKKAAGPVDNRKHKDAEQELLEKVNPQLDVMVEMQAGALEVENSKGADLLRHLDTEQLRTFLQRNYPGQQRMQAEGSPIVPTPGGPSSARPWR